MTQFVYKPSRIKNGKRFISRLYRGCYRLDGETKQTSIPLRTTDLQVAEKRLRDHVTRLQQERCGIRIPQASVDALAGPIGPLVEDYIADKTKTGKDARYVEQQKSMLLRLFSACGWNTIAEIRPDSFIHWRQTQTGCAKTLNEYLSAAKTFLKWIQQSKRIAFENPLQHVAKISEVGQETYSRRPFDATELRTLVAISGRRSIVYLTAAHTGLRRKELKTLTWADLDLDSAIPSVTVTPINAKNRKLQPLPLHDEVATALRALRDEKKPKIGDLVFLGIFPKRETYINDLKRAGISNYDDAAGKLHFHSLRHTLNHRLQLAGVPPTVAQHLMRHSSIALTTRKYIHPSSLPLADEMRKLSAILADSQIDSQNGDAPRLSESGPVANSINYADSQTVIDTGIRRVSTPPVATSRENENGARYRVRIR